MKTQRAHRRKLRFSSTKVAAPVAATKAERVPKQPVKRRTRQQRSRRVSPVSSSHNTAAQDLPSATWSDVQERLAAAKNLGELTHIMLQFFKKHEDLQGSASAPAFPIFVPASEIYKMKGSVCAFASVSLRGGVFALMNAA
ncbi:Coatomer subunit alpha-1 [Phytophthora cinnamomi]|uniref:Coatomer subunit alpha-1 n=1 Tax=Phytophthora cinnamomi TaxID=4785 RepID=UPI00355992D1|nr:Coatomer subunit alpha-1 [Phytophthora cinnamomi]